MPKQMSHREALKQAFTHLCEQYAAMGDQIKTVAALISPYVQGQDLTGDTKVELYSPGESAIMRDANDARTNHGPKPPPIRPIEN